MMESRAGVAQEGGRTDWLGLLSYIRGLVQTHRTVDEGKKERVLWNCVTTDDEVVRVVTVKERHHC